MYEILYPLSVVRNARVISSKVPTASTVRVSRAQLWYWHPNPLRCGQKRCLHITSSLPPSTTGHRTPSSTEAGSISPDVSPSTTLMHPMQYSGAACVAWWVKRQELDLKCIFWELSAPVACQQRPYHHWTTLCIGTCAESVSSSERNEQCTIEGARRSAFCAFWKVVHVTALMDST